MGVRRRPHRPARPHRRHRPAVRRPLPARPLRPGHGNEPLGVPRRRLRRADDRPLSALPARHGRRRTAHRRRARHCPGDARSGRLMTLAANTGRLGRLGHFTARHRWWVIGAWVVLTLFGGFAAGQLSSRWYQSLSVPGKPAYEASQRTLKALGVGDRSPSVVVFHTSGDATKTPAIERAMRRAADTMPGALTSSYFSTGSLMYVSRDRHTTFEQVYPPGPAGLDKLSGAERLRAAAAGELPAGIAVNVTGRDPLGEASTRGSSAGSSVLLEAVIGGIGALVILLFVFGTLPAVMMPLAVAVAAILNTFTLVWGLTYITDVSIIVQFLIALVGLGVAIDYALLMI